MGSRKFPILGATRLVACHTGLWHYCHTGVVVDSADGDRVTAICGTLFILPRARTAHPTATAGSGGSHAGLTVPELWSQVGLHGEANGSSLSSGPSLQHKSPGRRSPHGPQSRSRQRRRLTPSKGTFALLHGVSRRQKSIPDSAHRSVLPLEESGEGHGQFAYLLNSRFAQSELNKMSISC